ncbi:MULTISPECIES: molybdopterin converting factor subunit 1 [Pseudomonas]|uniref:Molybdopterin synthase sulfur carrier subunit n=1 Tax=Pseudomonas syringae pv. antirrhini TaxID=251702 RepID=A0A0P9LI42_9PSED|nr:MULTISPECIES: molybdopterin converting factor subunit 1 [Pseudomonas]KPW35684.1 Molybdenum cofactor biosynthesis protein D [Pseudomonas syringae pv. apii]KPW43917.1 Molybdenum cofactor biosynthesis protein D [Pseudomonas syringae pv. antirrhini]KPW53842.1 Molybdenum cofactor biosynthesis protein D [Pseudomonas syringae pv. berberidis]MCF5222353.1 molybdopterin converting factor subunit 1 [Pseudomonas syringae]MCF5240005.1 molybdopterin converting factor subunit 1 [Pseudomonas syringae]
MKIEVQYFARYRETLGIDSESVEGEFVTLEVLRQHLSQRGEAWQVLAEQNLMCARNQELCKLDEPLLDGDEVAFFPPVTGG